MHTGGTGRHYKPSGPGLDRDEEDDYSLSPAAQHWAAKNKAATAARATRYKSAYHAGHKALSSSNYEVMRYREQHESTVARTSASEELRRKRELRRVRFAEGSYEERDSSEHPTHDQHRSTSAPTPKQQRELSSKNLREPNSSSNHHKQSGDKLDELADPREWDIVEIMPRSTPADPINRVQKPKKESKDPLRYMKEYVLKKIYAPKYRLYVCTSVHPNGRPLYKWSLVCGHRNMQFDRAVQYGEPRVLRKVSKREVEPIDLGNNGTDLDTLAFVEIAQIKEDDRKRLEECLKSVPLPPLAILELNPSIWVEEAWKSLQFYNLIRAEDIRGNKELGSYCAHCGMVYSRKRIYSWEISLNLAG